MNIALIAHDQKKQDMVTFTIEAKEILKDHKLYATGTTGKRITEAANLDVTRFLSGPLGGDQQIGSLVASNDIDLVIFFRDPLMAQPMNRIFQPCCVYVMYITCLLPRIQSVPE